MPHVRWCHVVAEGGPGLERRGSQDCWIRAILCPIRTQAHSSITHGLDLRELSRHDDSCIPSQDKCKILDVITANALCCCYRRCSGATSRPLSGHKRVGRLRYTFTSFTFTSTFTTTTTSCFYASSCHVQLPITRPFPSIRNHFSTNNNTIHWSRMMKRSRGLRIGAAKGYLPRAD